MADKIVSWGGIDSKGTTGMGVTGSFSVSGSIATNADIALNSTSSRTSTLGFYGSSGFQGTLGSSYHTLAVDGSNNFVWSAFSAGGYSTTPLTLSAGSSWLIPGTMKIGSITTATINSNGSYTGQYATLTITGGGYNDGTNPSINFITWDAGNTTSRFQIHSRTLGGGNGKIVAVPNNGNFIIGASTDLSAKLAVRGSGTTSSTTALLVQNSNASASLSVTDARVVIANSKLFVGTFTPGANILANHSIITDGKVFAGGGLNLYSSPEAGHDPFVGFLYGGTGIRVFIDGGDAVQFGGYGGSTDPGITVFTNFNPSSGTTAKNNFVISTNYQASGTYSGGIRGFYYIPTLASIASASFHRAIETTSGDVILNGGKVGVGISTPSASLHISGASSNVLLEIDSPSANNILYVSGSGNVGIGTGTPRTALDVNGTISVGASGSSGTITFPTTVSGFATSIFTTYANNRLTIQCGGNTNIQFNSWIDLISAGNNIRIDGGIHTTTLATNNVVRFANSGSAAVNTTYFSSTNVGINTTSPSAKLHVVGSGTTASTTSLLVQNANASASLSVLDGVSVSSFQVTAGNFTDSTFYRDNLWRPASLASARDITVGSDGTLNGYSSRLNFITYYSNGGQGNQSNFAGYVRTTIGQYTATSGPGGNQPSGRGTLLLGVYDSDYSSTVLNSFDVVSVGKYATTISGSLTVSSILTLTPQSPLPSGVPTGSFAVSSSAPPKPYFYDGTTWNALY
jgi:hypothetical protein